MDDARNEPLSCPFCEFSDHDSYFLSQHAEVCHPEEEKSPSDRHDDSEAAIRTAEENFQRVQCRLTNEHGDRNSYIDCPHGCGESVTTAELQTHLDLHVAETLALEDSGKFDDRIHRANCENSDFRGSFEIEQCLSDAQHLAASHDHDPVLKVKSSETGRRREIRETATHTGGSIKRLGRAELGPYAHEKQMPAWLRKLLQNGAKVTRLNKIGPNGSILRDEIVENETSQVIPVLMQLCQQDSSVQRAFFCSPKVRHIFKLPREGGFCGYRNIQMLISHIKEAQRPGHEHFPGRVPSILELQDLIERAWDMGYNSTGRIETGGIKGTRKYIGTPEAQALFLSLGIRCEASAFSRTESMRAHDALLQAVAAYFRSGCSVDGEEKVLKTDLPPIYFQHQGHSMTIIGFEVRENGSANLLVFDPMFKTSPAIKRLIGQSVKASDPARLMKAWRRGVPYLQKYNDFELLRLCV